MNRLLHSMGCGLSVLMLGCDLVSSPEDVVCTAALFPSIVAEIRDEGGNPAALGATVTIRNKQGRENSAEATGDGLHVSVYAGGQGGIFDVEIRKPWHAEGIIRNVFVPAGPCGVREPRVVRATISLLETAPPVRQVVLPPHGYGFGASVCGMRQPIAAYVLTAAGASREAVWTSRDESIVKVEPGQTFADGLNSAMLVPQCRQTYGEAFVVAEAAADASVRDSVQVGVFAR